MKLKDYWFTATVILVVPLTFIAFFINVPAPKPQVEVINLSAGYQGFWHGEAIKFRARVSFTEKDQTFEKTVVALESQSSNGEWQQEKVVNITKGGTHTLTDSSAPSVGVLNYRAAVYQGDEFLAASEMKKKRGFAKKKGFTYEGHLGYRFFTEKEYENFTCKSVNRCWALYVTSNVPLKTQLWIRGERLDQSKKITKNLIRANKVSKVELPALNNTGSGWFKNTQSVLSGIEVQRLVAEEVRQKKIRNKPPTQTATPKPTRKPLATAQECSAWRAELIEARATLESWRPTDWSSWYEWTAQAALANFLNSGDISGAAQAAEVIESLNVYTTLLSRC
jgi:hypothetical protein